MCDFGASALAIASITVAAVSAAAGTTMSVLSAVQTQQANEFNSDVAKNNAKQSEQQAQLTLEQGREQERLQRLRTAQVKGSQRASYSASGVVVDQGSALDTIFDTTQKGEYDALTMRQNSAYQAYGANVQANDLKAQSSLYQNSADNAWISGMAGVGNSLMSASSGVIGGLKQMGGSSSSSNK